MIVAVTHPDRLAVVVLSPIFIILLLRGFWRAWKWYKNTAG